MNSHASKIAVAAPLAHDRPRANDRIAVFEGVRGWLALSVLVYHSMLFSSFRLERVETSWLRYTLAFFTLGDHFVSVFMILSGFVVFLLLDEKRETYGVFITRRWLRLWPMLAVTLLIGVVLSPLHGSALRQLSWADPWMLHQADLTSVHEEHAWANVAAHVTMLHGLVPSSWWRDATGAFIGVGWSIATEWQFYLLAPAAFYLMQRAWGRYLMCALVAGCRIWTLQGGFAWMVNESQSFIGFKAHYFFLGAVSYFIYQARNKPSRPLVFKPDWFVTCGLAACLAVSELPSLAWVAVFSLVMFGAGNRATRLKPITALFTNPLSQYLGKISYSIYLFHWTAIIIVIQCLAAAGKTSLEPLEAFAWICGGVLALTLVGSHVLFYGVEQPCIRFGKKLFRAKLAVGAEQQTAIRARPAPRRRAA